MCNTMGSPWEANPEADRSICCAVKSRCQVDVQAALTPAHIPGPNTTMPYDRLDKTLAARDPRLFFPEPPFDVAAAWASSRIQRFATPRKLSRSRGIVWRWFGEYVEYRKRSNELERARRE